MEQVPIAAGPLEASVRELPPQHPGQARTMLVCETDWTESTEVGHWYSPEKVTELLSEEREACAVAAWMAGMDAHTKARGMPCDARKVGSAGASAIRMRSNAELSGPRPLAAEGSRSNDVLCGKE